MDFQPPEHLKSLLTTIREFRVQHIEPLERDFVGKPFRQMLPALRELRGRVKGLGLLAPHMPKEFGCLGLALPDFAHVSEELGRTPLGHYVFGCQAPDVGNMEILLRLRERRAEGALARAAGRGEHPQLLLDDRAGEPRLEPAWLGTRAVREGDDYVIDGHKWFTTSADGAAFAIVMAVTNPEAPDAHRAPARSSCRPTRPASGSCATSRSWATRARAGPATPRSATSDCRVPLQNLLGPEGAGFAIAQERLGPGRIHHCMRWIGICERAFDMMCRRAATRELAPGKPLATRQTVQHWIAESRAEIDAARLMVLHAAWKIEQTVPMPRARRSR